MAKRNSRNTRGRIISAAWKLFYEQGYDGTTVEDIVFESGTSKGSFYHYFDGKDALMGTLAYVFDEKYEDLMPTLNPEKGAIETLAYINHELYVMIESSVSIDLLTRLLSTQLLARGEKHLLDRSRVYFRLLKKIVRQGAERGEFRLGLAQEEIGLVGGKKKASHAGRLSRERNQLRRGCRRRSLLDRTGRDRPGLRHVGTGAALRLVSVRRRLLAGGLRGEDDAPVFGEFPSQRINLIFCFSSIPSFCTV